MAEFILASGVEDELWIIWEHITEDNPDAATRVIQDAVRKSIALASSFPQADTLDKLVKLCEEQVVGYFGI